MIFHVFYWYECWYLTLGKKPGLRVKFEVLTVVTRMIVFWYVILCSLVDQYQCFKGMVLDLLTYTTSDPRIQWSSYVSHVQEECWGEYLDIREKKWLQIGDNLHSEEVRNCTFCQILFGWSNPGWDCKGGGGGLVVYMEEVRNKYKILVWKSERKTFLEDLSIDGRIILKWIGGNKVGGRTCTGFRLEPLYSVDPKYPYVHLSIPLVSPWWSRFETKLFFGIYYNQIFVR
jgi:hypothetical protein